MSDRTVNDLKQLQALPLNIKVKLTKSRIRQWINAYGEDGVYVSFSGGKDSTVLLHIVREDYPNIPAVFVDTGLEFPELREHVKKFDNVEIVKPKMNFKQVINKYGYPMFSKDISKNIFAARRYLKAYDDRRKNDPQNRTPIRGFYDFSRIAGVMHGVVGGSGNEYFEAIRDGSISPDIIEAIKRRDAKWVPEGEAAGKSRLNNSRYQFMLTAPFSVSSMCCNVMKKDTAHRYQKEHEKNPMTAQMADESKIRLSQWLANGCNGFDLKIPLSNPMAFWTEQDVLWYIKENNIEIPSVYGKIVSDDEIDGQMNIYQWLEGSDQPSKLHCTGCNRTGCVFCLYGYHLEKRPNRLDVMGKVTRPQLLDYMLRGGDFAEDGLWKPGRGGLGFWFPILWCNIHGNMKMHIPNCDHYVKEYGTEATAECLQ